MVFDYEVISRVLPTVTAARANVAIEEGISKDIDELNTFEVGHPVPKTIRLVQTIKVGRSWHFIYELGYE